MFSNIINRIREALNHSNPKQAEHVCTDTEHCPLNANNEDSAAKHNDANLPWEGYEPAHRNK